MSLARGFKMQRGDTVLGIAGLVLLLGVFFYFSGQSQQALRKSPSGFDGLSHWLAEGGQDVRNFTGGWTMEAESVGLRILPLFDTQLNSVRLRPKTKEELLLQVDEYDLRRRVVQSKIASAPTLLVLPKWRSGMRLTGLAHPDLLLPDNAPANLLRRVFTDQSFNVRLIPKPFTDVPVEDANGGSKTVRLYIAQVMEGERCTPLIGTQEQMVLGLCKAEDAAGGQVMVLSDPDLINNHGLRLGDNAHVIRDVLKTHAAPGLIMIDYSTGIWLRSAPEQEVRARSWSDLMQFFAYPFSVLWGSVACLMALILWRAGFRYGPLQRDRSGFGASKLVANTARARLMRLTGQDSRMLPDYVRTRLQSVATEYLGLAHASQPDAAMRYIARKRPDLAPELEAVLDNMRNSPSWLTAQAAIDYVDQLETILERLKHDT